jgi:pimeloyl-ACP methyl ester carboxylesterase
MSRAAVTAARHLTNDGGRGWGTQVQPYTIHAEQVMLDDWQLRLRRVRWPTQPGGAGWDNGTDLGYLQEFVAYWEGALDWHAQETYLNQFAQFHAHIDGLRIHFIHERGVGPNPLPLVLAHGWPGTFAEFLPLIALLTDPAAHGGDASDAFDVVVPALPGFAFSDPPRGPAFSNRIPTLWVRLMERLGYERFAAHGLDVGNSVCNRLALEFPERLFGIHLTYPAEPYLGPGAPDLSAAERAFLGGRPGGQEAEGGYAHIQRTKPQTLAYGLTDSPVGLAAWLIEKFRAWSDCDGDVERRFSKDELLRIVMLYWLSGTIGSSFQVYRDWALGAESNPSAWAGREDVPRGIASKPLARDERIEVPAALALFPADPPSGMPREWAERAYSDLRRFTRFPQGGHFPGLEEPELLAEDLRDFFRPFRIARKISA